MIKGILIDLGNTILENVRFSFKKGLDKVYNFVGDKGISYSEYLNIEKEMRKTTYSLRDETGIEIKLSEYLKLLNKNAGIKVEVSFNDLESEFLKAAVKDKPIKGIEKFLEYAFFNNIPVIIVSNSTFTGRLLFQELQDFKLTTGISSLISSADVGYRKPRKEIFLKGIEELRKIDDFEDNEICYIGNDYNIDMIGAKNTGLVPIWFNREKNMDVLNICDFIFDDYLELIDYFKKEKI